MFRGFGIIGEYENIFLSLIYFLYFCLLLICLCAFSPYHIIKLLFIAFFSFKKIILFVDSFSLFNDNYFLIIKNLAIQTQVIQTLGSIIDGKKRLVEVIEQKNRLKSGR